jgi:hypothetical protein
MLTSRRVMNEKKVRKKNIYICILNYLFIFCTFEFVFEIFRFCMLHTSSEEIIWTATLNHVKVLLNLIKALHSTKWLIWTITHHGLKWSTQNEHDSINTLAHAYLESQHCQHYKFHGEKEEEYTFKLDLHALLEYLHMWANLHMDKMGHTPSLPLRMTYQEARLTLLLQEDNMTSMANFKVGEILNPLPSLDFHSSELISRIIIKVKKEKESSSLV